MNISILMKILECIGAFLLVLSIFKVVDSYKYWMLYVLSSIIYVINMIYLGSIPYAIMGVILLLTGIKNYKAGRKKYEEKESERY